jgi:hypothetical protein
LPHFAFICEREKKLQAFLWERFLSSAFAFYILSALVADDRSHLFAKEILSHSSPRSRSLFIANFRGNFQHHAIFMILIFSSLLLPPRRPSFMLKTMTSTCSRQLFAQAISLFLAPSFFPRHTQCRSSSPFIRRIIMLFLLLSSLFFLLRAKIFVRHSLIVSLKIRMSVSVQR